MYSHDYPGNFVVQQYRPDSIADKTFWHPCSNPAEDVMRQRHESRRGKKSDAGAVGEGYFTCQGTS